MLVYTSQFECYTISDYTKELGIDPNSGLQARMAVTDPPLGETPNSFILASLPVQGGKRGFRIARRKTSGYPRVIQRRSSDAGCPSV